MLTRRSYANSFSSSPAFRMVSHKTASLRYASMTALVVKGKILATLLFLSMLNTEKNKPVCLHLTSAGTSLVM
jgi:hypothetical protein